MSRAAEGSLLLALLLAIGSCSVLALRFVERRRSRAASRELPGATPARRAGLLLAVLASCVLCVLCAALSAGYEEATRGEAPPLRDSAGHELGFNSPLTWELAGMLLRRATFGSLLDALWWYGIAFLAVHAAAVLVLARIVRPAPRAVAVGWWLQLVVFPSGWLGCLMLPAVLLGGVDGEGLIDVPFWWTAQPLWLGISALGGIWWEREARAESARRMVARAPGAPLSAT